jgi:hypothetical protein
MYQTVDVHFEVDLASVLIRMSKPLRAERRQKQEASTL